MIGQIIEHYNMQVNMEKLKENIHINFVNKYFLSFG